MIGLLFHLKLINNCSGASCHENCLKISYVLHGKPCRNVMLCHIA